MNILDIGPGRKSLKKMIKDYYWEVSYSKPYQEPFCTVWRQEVEKFADGHAAQARFQELKDADYRHRAQIKFVEKEKSNYERT